MLVEDPEHGSVGLFVVVQGSMAGFLEAVFAYFLFQLQHRLNKLCSPAQDVSYSRAGLR
jgi:hypothetical protein